MGKLYWHRHDIDRWTCQRACWGTYCSRGWWWREHRIWRQRRRGSPAQSQATVRRAQDYRGAFFSACSGIPSENPQKYGFLVVIDPVRCRDLDLELVEPEFDW